MTQTISNMKTGHIYGANFWTRLGPAMPDEGPSLVRKFTQYDLFSYCRDYKHRVNANG
jgi:hypothetical protein